MHDKNTLLMHQNWKFGLLILVFLTMPVLFIIEIKYLNRTLYARQMLLSAMMIGLVLGIVLGYRFQKKMDEAVVRMRTFAVSIVLGVILLPLLASLSNRLFGLYPIQNVPVELVEVSPRYSSRFGISPQEKVTPHYYITFFYKDQKLLNIHTQVPLFPNAERGDTVTLPIKKGLWGYEIIAQP